METVSAFNSATVSNKSTFVANHRHVGVLLSESDSFSVSVTGNAIFTLHVDKVSRNLASINMHSDLQRRAHTLLVKLTVPVMLTFKRSSVVFAQKRFTITVSLGTFFCHGFHTEKDAKDNTTCNNGTNDSNRRVCGAFSDSAAVPIDGASIGALRSIGPYFCVVAAIAIAIAIAIVIDVATVAYATVAVGGCNVVGFRCNIVGGFGCNIVGAGSRLSFSCANKCGKRQRYKFKHLINYKNYDY